MINIMKAQDHNKEGNLKEENKFKENKICWHPIHSHPFVVNIGQYPIFLSNVEKFKFLFGSVAKYRDQDSYFKFACLLLFGLTIYENLTPNFLSAESSSFSSHATV